MNTYRTHTCGELTKKDSGQKVILSGWINKKRDHGNLLFLDLFTDVWREILLTRLIADFVFAMIAIVYLENLYWSIQ